MSLWEVKGVWSRAVNIILCMYVDVFVVASCFNAFKVDQFVVRSAAYPFITLFPNLLAELRPLTPKAPASPSDHTPPGRRLQLGESGGAHV